MTGPPATTPRAGLAKRRVRVGAATVAYLDEGPGCPAGDGAPPLLFLHGCPFSSFARRCSPSPDATRPGRA
jgi:pimeloyl-ACP methyl ester carboxylesterase